MENFFKLIYLRIDNKSFFIANNKLMQKIK